MIPKRIRFRWRNRSRLRVTESLKATLIERCQDANRANVSAYSGIYNVGLFVVLVEQDISAYSESIFLAKSEWHRQFFARGLAVLLYEATEDLPELLGKDFRQWLKDLAPEQRWMAGLNSIVAKLNEFRKARRGFLGDVRNFVGAHHDHNALSQVDAMAKFKAIDVYRLGAEFSEPLRELIAFYTQLLAHMHIPAVMLRHVAKTTP